MTIETLLDVDNEAWFMWDNAPISKIVGKIEIAVVQNQFCVDRVDITYEISHPNSGVGIVRRNQNDVFGEFVYADFNELHLSKREFFIGFEVGFSHYPSDGWVFEQYTGLKDKNDKDIYEGDILHSDDYHINGVVVYDPEKCYYNVVDVDDYADGTRFNSNMINVAGDHWMEYEITVVGDIHQHPELLNNQKETKEG